MVLLTDFATLLLGINNIYKLITFSFGTFILESRIFLKHYCVNVAPKQGFYLKLMRLLGSLKAVQIGNFVTQEYDQKTTQNGKTSYTSLNRLLCNNAFPGMETLTR